MMKKASGNLCKTGKPLEVLELEDGLCGKVCGYPRKPGPACKMQVFACMESAQETARALRPLGITATPGTCSKCGMIHLHESRNGKA
jgi:hypothetical protein